jgi:hypothetical protein
MKFENVFKLVFGGFGIVCLTVCVFTTRATLVFRSGAVQTTGKVIGFDKSYTRGQNGSYNRRMYAPVVEFEGPHGVERFVDGVSSSSRGYAIGQSVEVLYPPAAPEKAELRTFFGAWFAPLLTGFLGAAFGGVALGFVIVGERRRRMYAWLAEHGNHIKAVYVGVVRDTSMSVNGRNPRRLQCQWVHPITRAVYVMESEALWFDPTPYVKRESLDVLVDLDNPRRYRVDVGFLPKPG